MKASEITNEVYTSLGLKYQELYTKYYKRAHLKARKMGLVGKEADNFARRAVDAYKDRVRTGEWDPITRTRTPGGFQAKYG